MLFILITGIFNDSNIDHKAIEGVVLEKIHKNMILGHLSHYFKAIKVSPLCYENIN
jgi:hypothetical protein